MIQNIMNSIRSQTGWIVGHNGQPESFYVIPFTPADPSYLIDCTLTGNIRVDGAKVATFRDGEANVADAIINYIRDRIST